MTRYFGILILSACCSATAHAQAWNWELGAGLGYSTFTPTLGRAQTGLSSGGGAEVMWRSGPLLQLHAGRTFTDRWSVRLRAEYSERALTGNDLGDTDFISATNIWTGTLGVLFRLRSLRSYADGYGVAPFVGVGAGLRWINPGLDQFTCRNAAGATQACVPLVTGGSGPNARGWALRAHTVPHAALSVGTDVRLARRILLRAELSDHVFKPVVERADPVDGREWTIPSSDNRSRLVHEPAASLSVHMLFGVPNRVVATVGAPAKAVGPPAQVEACPQLAPSNPALFDAAPLRASVVGTVITARQKLQTVLDALHLTHERSGTEHLGTAWSRPYPHPEQPGYQRRHALLFEFVPVIGGTDVLARWVICSAVDPGGSWFVLQADKLSQPEEVERILDAVRRR